MERLKSWAGEKKDICSGWFQSCTWTSWQFSKLFFFLQETCVWNVAMHSNGNVTCDSVFSRDSERCCVKMTVSDNCWTFINITIIKSEGWLIVKAQEKKCFGPITVDVMDKNLLSANSDLKIYLNNSWFHFHLPKHQPRMVSSTKIISHNIYIYMLIRVSGMPHNILDICSTRVRYRWWFTVSAAAFVTFIPTSIVPSLFGDFSLRTETDIRCQCQVLVGSRHFKTCSITFLKYS